MDHTKVRIVLDSSADMPQGKEIEYASVPLTVRTEEKEYVDDGALDVANMIAELARYKGRSSSSCPNMQDWLDAFGEAEYVFCIAITSKLSGSYNAACLAGAEYEAGHPERRVFVLDSRSAGPELRLLAAETERLVLKGLDFDAAANALQAYSRRSAVVFMLASLTNLANNGRVSHLAAKVAGVLGMRLVGEASEAGELAPLHKCRGEGRALEALFHHMEKKGYAGGNVRIAHCENLTAAETLRGRITEKYPDAQVEIYATRGLCSYYAESGGLLVGYERGEEKE